MDSERNILGASTYHTEQTIKTLRAIASGKTPFAPSARRTPDIMEEAGHLKLLVTSILDSPETELPMVAITMKELSRVDSPEG